MAMTPNGLKDAINSAIQGRSDSTSSILTDLGNGIADYIKNNAEFDFEWDAVNGSGDPDPITETTGEVVNLTISLTPSNATTPGPGVSQFSSQVTAGLKVGQYNITAGGFSTSPGIMSDIPNLILSVSGSDRDAAIMMLAQPIIDWLHAYVPAAPCSGSHGSYTGTGTVTAIN